MINDYTEIFNTPRELADFLCLGVAEQDRILAELTTQGANTGAVMSCTLTHTLKQHKGKS